MTVPNLPRPFTVYTVPPRPIPIRTVPRAALEALVARLQAQGLRHIVTAEGSPHGG